MNLTSIQEERAHRIHRESIILLAHDHVAPPDDLKELQEGGVTAKILMAVLDARAWSSDPRDYQASIAQVDGWFEHAQAIYRRIVSVIEATPDLSLILSAGDVVRAKEAGRVGIILGSEGGKLIEHRTENLQTFHRQGLRHVLLSWAFNNQITAGELDSEGRGLTEFGRRVVHEMNRLGMVIDITHISRPAMREVLESSSRPVLNSHSALKAISRRIPAMTELEIRVLAGRGGVFALHFMTHMLTGRFAPQATLEELLAQVDAIVNIGGIDCLALGPDYLPYTEEFRRNTEQRELTFPLGLETPSTLINLTRALVWRGYSDEAIHKILGGNLLRFLRDTIG